MKDGAGTQLQELLDQLYQNLKELKGDNPAFSAALRKVENIISRFDARHWDTQSADNSVKRNGGKYRDLFENANDAVFVVDDHQNFLDANRKALEMIGFSREELLSMNVFDLIPKEQKTRSAEEFARLRQEGKYEKFRGKMLSKNGRWIDIEVSSSAIFDGECYIGSLDIMRDITNQVEVEEALRTSDRFIRNILDTVDEGFIVIDRDFRIINSNKAYCDQVGESTDQVIGRHCYEISHRRSRPCHETGEECAVKHVFETGEPSTALHRHTDGRGSILYVETKAFPIKDSREQVTSVIETVTNITEKHLLEEERLKTQKLEAIGILAGGIAHDFNNLLQGVFGYISMAKACIEMKDRSLAMLEQAEQAIHMSVNLTKQLLTFSKGGKPLKKKISLRPVIENSVKFALSGSRLDYSIAIDDDLRTVEADDGQIGQVIQNIILNADQAMPLGGMIAITAKNVQTPRKGSPPGNETRYVEIGIKDTGIGIPEPYLQKIFDPYFSTKEKGSGLGLATAYSIIRNHGGAIDVVSEPGKGTTFFVYLPSIDAEAEVPSARTVIPAARKGKILVMDDEELIRNIVGEQIKAGGHQVDFAEHGEAAIIKYVSAKQSGSPFDVVILDLTVRGGMGGKETIKRLLEIEPDVKAIVSSGYSDDTVMADYRAYGFSACLTKPYNLDDLKRVLNSLLS